MRFTTDRKTTFSFEIYNLYAISFYWALKIAVWRNLQPLLEFAHLELLPEIAEFSFMCIAVSLGQKGFIRMVLTGNYSKRSKGGTIITVLTVQSGAKRCSGRIAQLKFLFQDLS